MSSKKKGKSGSKKKGSAKPVEVAPEPAEAEETDSETESSSPSEEPVPKPSKKKVGKSKLAAAVDGADSSAGPAKGSVNKAKKKAANDIDEADDKLSSLSEVKSSLLSGGPKLTVRKGRFSEVIRKSTGLTTATLSSNRLSRRSVRASQGSITSLMSGGKLGKSSAAKGAPLNDSELQPNLVENFCTYLERYALGIQDIFSYELPELEARALAQALNQDPAVIDFSTVLDPPEVVAAALYTYLRAHRQSMIPSKSYGAFVEANARMDDADRVAGLRKCVSALPTSNRQICSRLFRLFFALHESSGLTGCDSARLGAQWGDSLLHDQKGDKASGADLVAFMVEHYHAVVLMGDFDAEQAAGVSHNPEYELDEDDWKLLLTNAKLFKYKAGQPVLREGEPNTRLFRVREGSFKVMKRGQHIGTLEPMSVFGEISFLGSYVADATFEAATEGAQLWILDLKFLQQMFAMEPELAMKLYHFIGVYLARRLAHFEAAAPAGKKAADGSAAPYVARTDQFVRVPPTAPVAASAAAGPARPKVPDVTEELVIRDYPCQLGSKHGTLYIMQHYLAHFAPVFGRERKKLILYDAVKEMRMDPNLTDVLLSRPDKSKISRLHFVNTQDCDEAFALIETMLMNRRAEVPVAPAEQHGRAVALFDFQPQHPSDLPLHVNDVVVVMQKRGDGWWLGQCRDRVGYFPSTYVRDDEGLPTIGDWEIVWLGGVTREFKKGKTILGAGDRPTALYQVLRGSCALLRDGKQVGILSQEETFGEQAFLTGQPSSHAVRALESVTVREIPVQFLHKLFENTASLASRVFKYLAVVLEMKLRATLDPASAAKKQKTSASLGSAAKAGASDDADDDAEPEVAKPKKSSKKGSSKGKKK